MVKSPSRFVYSNINDSDSAIGSAGNTPHHTKVKVKKVVKTRKRVARAVVNDSDSDGSEHCSPGRDVCGRGEDMSGVRRQYACDHDYDRQSINVVPPMPMASQKISLLTESEVEEGFFDEPTIRLSADTYMEVVNSPEEASDDSFVYDIVHTIDSDNSDDTAVPTSTSGVETDIDLPAARYVPDIYTSIFTSASETDSTSNIENVSLYKLTNDNNFDDTLLYYT